jgi:hypothetical protein
LPPIVPVRGRYEHADAEGCRPMGEDQRKGWPVPHRPSVRGEGADLIFTRVTGFAKLDEPGPTPTRTSCCGCSTGQTSRCTPTGRRTPSAVSSPNAGSPATPRPASRRGTPFSAGRLLQARHFVLGLPRRSADPQGSAAKIPDTDLVPWLPDHIRQHVSA